MQLSLVEGFEDFADYYQIERDGDRCWIVGKDGKVLKASIGNHGYRQIGLYLKSGKQKWILEHRIFAICFIENLEDKAEVNHIDGVKTNNSLSNLEWNTSSENKLHAFQTGLKQPILGENHGNAKLKDSEIPIIFNMRKTGLTQKAIGDYFGVDQSQISYILSGHSRSQNQ
jgi:hypothetical protein